MDLRSRTPRAQRAFLELGKTSILLPGLRCRLPATNGVRLTAEFLVTSSTALAAGITHDPSTLMEHGNSRRTWVKL